MFVEFETKGGWYVLRECPGGEVLVPRFWKENAVTVLDAPPANSEAILRAAKKAAQRRLAL